MNKILITAVLSAILSVASAFLGGTVKICARMCSDGSTVAKCIDTFGSISLGDCTLTPEPVDCPAPLQNVGYQFDLGESENIRYNEVWQCQQDLDGMRYKPNLPVIVTDEFQPPARREVSLTQRQQAIKDALEWHEDYSLYSDEEKMVLGERIVSNGKRSGDKFLTNEEIREIGEQMFNFVHTVRQLTNRSGVYTNSNCAGCSLIVQSVLEKLEGKGCSYITGVITSSVCDLSPVLSTFCQTILNAFEVETLLTTICQGAFKTLEDALDIREAANVFCSTLTCTNQPAQIENSSQITGHCDSFNFNNNERSMNERCDQLIRLCDMAEKGFCVGDTIKELKDETGGGFVDIALSTISSIVLGQTPPVAESVQKLAMQCTRVKCGGYDPEEENSSSTTPIDLAASVTPFALLLVISMAVAMQMIFA